MNIATDWELATLRLGAALVLGGLLGFERELHGKAAGLRTHMLVAVGSALFTLVSYGMPELLDLAADPTRIAAQVVTGIGFLGAGTIIRARGRVHGLTTAASVWLAAGVGMAAGSGYYLGAGVGTLFGHAILVLAYHFERITVRRQPGRHTVRAVVEGVHDVRWLHDLVREAGHDPMRWSARPEGDGLEVTIEGNFRKHELEQLIGRLYAAGTVRRLTVQRGIQGRSGR